MFGALKDAGGTAYSNYAVGYNNVKVEAGTQNGIAVGNTPGQPKPFIHASQLIIALAISRTECQFCHLSLEVQGMLLAYLTSF